jgi:hypothetical protein
MITPVLIPDPPKIMLHPWFKKQHHVWHGAHFDLAKNGDAAALAVSHVYGYDAANEPLIYLDLIVRWQGTVEEPFSIDIARRWLEYLHDELNFDFGLVTADTWQSSYLLEILREKGYKTATLSVDLSTDPYDELVQAIRSGRIDYYNNRIAINELTNLERFKGKYNHNRKGGKDSSDAWAGSTYNAIRCGRYGEPPIRENAQVRGTHAYTIGGKDNFNRRKR